MSETTYSEYQLGGRSTRSILGRLSQTVQTKVPNITEQPHGVKYQLLADNSELYLIFPARGSNIGICLRAEHVCLHFLNITSAADEATYSVQVF